MSLDLLRDTCTVCETDRKCFDAGTAYAICVRCRTRVEKTGCEKIIFLGKDWTRCGNPIEDGHSYCKCHRMGR